jgi:hypothetical protein
MISKIKKNQHLWFFKFCPFQFAPNLQVLLICPQIKSLLHFLSTSWFFFSYRACMPTSHSSSYAFNSINNTHQREL